VGYRRLRVAIGLLAVAAGATWAAGGTAALRDGAVLFLRTLPFVIAGAAILLLARAAVPRGRLGGPLLLLICGAVGVAVQFDIGVTFSARLMAPTALILGGLLLSLSVRFGPDDDNEQNWTRTSIIWPVHEYLRGRAPARLILRSFLGDVSVDLLECHYPMGENEVTIDITMIGGRLHLVVPLDWHLQPGRVELAKGMKLEGWMTRTSPLARNEDVERLVVLNLQGFRGTLRLSQPVPPAQPPRRRLRQAPRRPPVDRRDARSDNPS
jgi:hypothetical protein